jgi:hypothetical protein
MTDNLVRKAWHGSTFVCAWFVRVVVLTMSTTASAHADPIGLAWGDGSLWVSDVATGTIYNLDPFSDTVIHSFTPPFLVGSRIRDLAWDGNRVWAAYWADPNSGGLVDLPSKIYAFDPSDGSIEASFVAPFAGHPDGLAYDGALLWVGEEERIGGKEGHVYGIDPSSGLIVSDFLPPLTSGLFNPRGIAWDGMAFWLGFQSISTDQIRRVDGSGNVLSSIDSPFGECQQGLAYDGTYLWATGSCGTLSISQIDPLTGNVRFSFVSDVFAPAPVVPEPSTLVLVGLGAVSALVTRCRRLGRRRSRSATST